MDSLSFIPLTKRCKGVFSFGQHAVHLYWRGSRVRVQDDVRVWQGRDDCHFATTRRIGGHPPWGSLYPRRLSFPFFVKRGDFFTELNGRGSISNARTHVQIHYRENLNT